MAVNNESEEYGKGSDYGNIKGCKYLGTAIIVQNFNCK
jgi:hypothetical protein